MGEYVHASITICGHIPSVEAFDELVNAIESKGLGELFAANTRADLVAMFVDALVRKESPCFESHEINYGNLDEVTSVCEEYDIAYERTSEAVGDSDAEEACWYPGDEHEFSREDTVLSWPDLEKLLAGENPLDTLRDRCAQMKRASGAGLPSLSVSDDVRDHLAVDIARARVAA